MVKYLSDEYFNLLKHHKKEAAAGVVCCILVGMVIGYSLGKLPTGAKTGLPNEMVGMKLDRQATVTEKVVSTQTVTVEITQLELRGQTMIQPTTITESHTVGGPTHTKTEVEIMTETTTETVTIWEKTTVSTTQKPTTSETTMTETHK